MNKQRMTKAGGMIAGLVSALLIFSLTGCQSMSAPSPKPDEAEVPLVGPGSTVQPGKGQELFTSDKAAAAALLVAVKKQDHPALHRIFGPAIKALVSSDKVEAHRHFEKFVAHAEQKFRLQKQNANTSIVYIGKKNWPFPIPIVRMSDGKWFFDTQAGLEEILERRVGRNELEAVHVCRVYVLAQREYFAGVPQASGMPQYAGRFVSKPGTHDGLYWPVAKGQVESPFGPLAAQAVSAGYMARTPAAHKGPRPFYGYYFHILRQQGPAAPGGAIHYALNGKLIAGFAMVAFPANYGSSGIMTFIVNQQGVVYQRDLGPNTLKIARSMQSYNPGPAWMPVKP